MTYALPGDWPSDEAGAVAKDQLVDTLTHVWLTSIYGEAP